MFRKNVSNDQQSREARNKHRIDKLNQLKGDLSQKRINFETYIENYLDEAEPKCSEHWLWVSHYSDEERTNMMSHLEKLDYKPELVKQENDFAEPYYRIDFTAAGRNENYEDFSDLHLSSSFRQ
jgi:hypothetical protein